MLLSKAHAGRVRYRRRRLGRQLHCARRMKDDPMKWSCPRCARRFAAGGRCSEDGTTLVQLTSPSDPLIGLELGGYTLKARLGRGGMGAVYRALQHSVGRDVALKVISSDKLDDTKMAERFMREAHVAAQLSHPNIVTVLDFGQHADGTLYLAMELVEGITLSKLTSAGPVEPERAIRIGVQICAALEAMHARHIIHRDLKPANVVLMSAPPDTVKVLDFGLARFRTDPHLTASQQVVGSPSYLSPEAARGEEPDGRADLYALGGVLYHLLEGAAPFGEGDFSVVLGRQLDGTTRRWERQQPLALRALVESLLDPDPDHRPASAADVRERLTALLELNDAPAQSEIRPLDPDSTRLSAPTALGRRPAAVMLLPLFAALGVAAVVVAALKLNESPSTAPLVVFTYEPLAVVDAGAAPPAVTVAEPEPHPPDAGVKTTKKKVTKTRFEDDGLAGKNE